MALGPQNWEEILNLKITFTGMNGLKGKPVFLMYKNGETGYEWLSFERAYMRHDIDLMIKQPYMHEEEWRAWNQFPVAYRPVIFLWKWLKMVIIKIRERYDTKN